MAERILDMENLHVSFDTYAGEVKAVRGVTLHVDEGEVLAIVGESGCGKSTQGRTLMGIYQPTKGKLIYDGRPVDLSNKKERFAFAKKAQIVFQDPYASLDPRMTVGSIIEEGMIIHNMYDAKRRQERVAELLATVGLNREHANRFPHEFSGGQRQRIGIARALAIETARSRHRIPLEGDVPSPINKPRGCAFSSRCPMACDKCRQSAPVLKEAAPGHFVACHLVEG